MLNRLRIQELGVLLAFVFMAAVPVDGETLRAFVLSCSGKVLTLERTGSGFVVDKSVLSLSVFSTNRFDGCLVGSPRYDRRSDLVYAAIALQPDYDDAGTRPYQINGFSLPTWKKQSTTSLPAPSAAMPILLIDPTGHRVIASVEYPSENQSAFIVPAEKDKIQGSAQQMNTLKPVAPGLYAFHTEEPFFNEASEIIDGADVLDAQGKLVEKVNGYALLTPNITAPLKSLQRIGAQGRPFLDITYAASGGTKLAFVVGWDSDRNELTSGGMVIYDTVLKRAVSAFTVPYKLTPFAGEAGTPNVHLTPDGEKLLIESYIWKSEPADQAVITRERFKTGELALYSVKDGVMIRKLQLPKEPGAAGRVLGFSDDSQFLFYVAAEQFYVVDLEAGSLATTVTLPTAFDPTYLLTQTH